MFCSTVSHGKTPYSWNITPRSGPGPVISRPSSVTRPDVGLTKPAAMFISVVLPQPDGPTSAMKSPWLMEKLMSLTTSSMPPSVGNCIDTF